MARLPLDIIAALEGVAGQHALGFQVAQLHRDQGLGAAAAGQGEQGEGGEHQFVERVHGGLRPAIAASRRDDAESFYFLADYHALIKTADPARVQHSTLEIAAAWLACGLDPNRVWFYRQSDIPEVPELTWLLTCVAGKGLLNRAHAYKAAVDRNLELGDDADAGVNAGLFMYPVLMAADIVMFKANSVPVGRDQIQHIEMARDFAARFNHLYGEPAGKQYFVLPEAAIEASVATLPGLDGRKMSKSYDNTIPLFAPRAELKKRVYSILTDSRAPGEPKDTEGSALFQLYQAFASAEQTAEFAQAFAEGIAWGDAKQKLFERIDTEIAPMRDKYEALIAKPIEIEAVLVEGALKARKLATPFMAELRHAVGLRPLHMQMEVKAQNKGKAFMSAIRASQFRLDGGTFGFKIEGFKDKVTQLRREGFADARACGAALKDLMATPVSSLVVRPGPGAYTFELVCDGAVLAVALGYQSAAQRDTAMQSAMVDLQEWQTING